MLQSTTTETEIVRGEAEKLVMMLLFVGDEMMGLVGLDRSLWLMYEDFRNYGSSEIKQQSTLIC